MNTVRERLIWARGQRGLSTPQLGELAKVHHVTIQRIEAGDGDKQAIKTPRPATLYMLARALKVRPEWLAEGSGEPGYGLTEPKEDAPTA